MGGNMENSLGVVLISFCCIFGVLWGFNYSKMVNLGPRTCSNTFWMILGTSKMLSKYGPVDLPIITEILQKIQESMGTSLKHIIFHI